LEKPSGQRDGNDIELDHKVFRALYPHLPRLQPFIVAIWNSHLALLFLGYRRQVLTTRLIDDAGSAQHTISFSNALMSQAKRRGQAVKPWREF